MSNQQDAYECGCHWERSPVYGDVLCLCRTHKAENDSRYEANRQAEAEQVWNDMVRGMLFRRRR